MTTKMKPWMVALLMLLWFLMLMPQVAFADDGTAMPSAVARLLDALLMILVPIAAAVGTVLAAVAAAWLQRKTGLNISQQLNDLVVQGVGFAEEKAHQALITYGKKMEGPEKLEAALNFALDLAEKYKLPTWARDRLAKLIEAELGKWRPMKKLEAAPVATASSPPA